MEEKDFRVLIDTDRLQERIGDLADTVSRDYGNRPLHLVGVLRGALQFTRDLSRRLTVPHSVDFISVTSYGDRTESSGRLRLRQELSQPIQGKDVLVVEDIVDTGLTLHWLSDHLNTLQPRSVAICCLLDKPARRQVPVATDYVGFTIEDLFVIGYGLDYQERFRELPFISCLSAA